MEWPKLLCKKKKKSTSGESLTFIHIGGKRKTPKNDERYQKLMFKSPLKSE